MGEGAITASPPPEAALSVAATPPFEILGLIVQSTNDGIWDWDLDSGAVRYMGRWMEFVGYAADEWPSTIDTLRMLMHPADWDRTTATIDAYLTRRQGTYQTEFRLRHKSGAWRWILSRGAAVWDEDGVPRRFVGTHTDVTETKEESVRLERLVAQRTTDLREANSRLKEARDRAEAAASTITRFLAAASHDIRQPVQALGLILDALAPHVGSMEGRRIQAAALTSLSAVRELLDALLDYSRIDAGAVRPSRIGVDLGPLLATVAEPFRLEAERRGLRLSTHCLPGLRGHTDPLLTARVLRNLVSNALRFTDTGGVMLTARPVAGQAAIEVWDTGCGIDPAEQRRIFSEFYQVPGPSLARGPGLGLGLTIVDGLARAMGQTVELVSRPGRGSRFRILMPLDRHGADATVAPSMPEAPADLLRDRLVLVVENDEQVRRGLAGVLGRWGARVIAAETGEDALGLTTAVCPHAIVADWHLTGAVDGFGVIERIRQRHSGHAVAAVILTADTNLKNLSSANPGGIAVLFKPVPPDILRSVLSAEIAVRSPARGA